MKLRFSKVIFISVFIQIVAIQGILTFNIFKLFGNWELKSILHPVGLLFLFVGYAIYIFEREKIVISNIDKLVFLYLLFQAIVLLYNTTVLSDLLYTFREVFLIFILIFIYNQLKILNSYWHRLLNLLHILILINIIFVFLTYILGPEEYMKFLTGKFVWANDPEYKFKITNYRRFLRTPALVGSPGAVGYFGLLAYFIFELNDTSKFKKFTALFLALCVVVRSVYLILSIYWFLSFILSKRNFKIIRDYLPFLLISISSVIIVLYSKGILNIYSVKMRINHWIEDINVEYNVVYGKGIGLVGASVKGEGFLSVLDSYWLLILISLGFLGIILLSLFIYEKIRFNRKLIYLSIGFVFAGFFITLTQGIPFLVLYPLLFLKNYNPKDELIHDSN